MPESSYELELTLDPHSYSQPDSVSVKHMELNLSVDFESRRLLGVVRLELERKKPCKSLILDIHHLDIKSARRVDPGGEAENVAFEVGESKPFLGSPLRVELAADTTWVEIEYSTDPRAGALQWLEKEQTADRIGPFLFTQSQAILARSWIPCQDSPRVRSSYSAKIEVPPGLMAVMSAANETEIQPSGEYWFEMPQPVPSYLLALAVGAFEFRSIGRRSGVYAERSVVEAAAWELGDTERMLSGAEQLYGPYLWDRFDVIILPPSFPFGGMENPRLTFATPTILAGDRSLVSLVAHELAHSWSGNLVTNATWNDFWLNEGFTRYFEHRIMERLYGNEFEEMLSVLALNRLEKEIEAMGAESPDTHLKLDLAGRDPDQGMNAIAYDKGQFFLKTLERAVGRKRWDAFVARYFGAFAFRSVTTEEFLSYLAADLEVENPGLLESVGVQNWVYGPGLPPNCPKVISSELDGIYRLVESFLESGAITGADAEGWTTQHWLIFLGALPDSLDLERLRAMDECFKLSRTGNSEILFRWLEICIASRFDASDSILEDFLLKQGRRKFLKPLYERLVETDEGWEKARRIYRKARPGYHPISRNTIDGILN